jgi:hypothetical protein
MEYTNSQLEAMRSIRAKSERFISESRSLTPRGGSVAIGGAYFDPFVKGESLAAFLRGLHAGSTAQQAAEIAKAFARESVKIFNTDREYQTRRSEIIADAVIDDAMRSYLSATEQCT